MTTLASRINLNPGVDIMFSPFARRQWMLGLIVGAMACEGPNVTSSTAASATRRSADVVPNAPPAGGLLTFDVPDPKGDATGPIDVRDMNFVLDNTSGAFSVTLQADPTAPFATGGTIDININLYNPAKSSFFHCNPVEFTLNAATQTIVLIGSSSELMTWEAGDQVYTNSLKGTPNPPNVTVYRSQVIWDFDVTATTEQEDVLAYSNLAKPAKLARSKTAALALQGLTCS